MSDRIECQSCSAPTTLFLCQRCQAELRAELHDLARGREVNDERALGLLEAVEDVALKRTKLGNTGGHRKRGDEMPVLFLPDTGKMVKDKTTGEDTDEPVLSPQGLASQLLVAARSTLSTIVRDLCESRGLDLMRAFRIVPADMEGPLMPGWRRALGYWIPTSPELAVWLAGAVHAIACDEGAGRHRADIARLVRQCERLVDRPVKIELLGFCITQTDDGTCDTALRAPEDAIEVRCRKCHTVRRCDTVRAQGQSDARRALIPWPKVLETNKTQPDGWRVNERTLRDWRATGALAPREYLRPDGTHGPWRGEDDVQLFKWNDVEQLRTHGVKRGDRKRTRAGR